jgi:hypothetical protein
MFRIANCQLVSSRRDGVITREEFLAFYGKVLKNSDDDAFEKGIARFYTASNIVTTGKIDTLVNDKLNAGLIQFKQFFRRMQITGYVNHLRRWRLNMLHAGSEGRTEKLREVICFPQFPLALTIVRCPRKGV